MFGVLRARRNTARAIETIQDSIDTTENSDGLTAQPVDRRNMLRLGGMAAAGAAGAAIVSVANATPAAAGTDGDLVLGADSTTNDAGTSQTSMKSSVGSRAFVVENTSTGSGIDSGWGIEAFVHGDGVGVIGTAPAGSGVEGHTTSGSGVFATGGTSGIGVNAFGSGGNAINALGEGAPSAIQTTNTGGGAALTAANEDVSAVFSLPHPGPAIVAQIQDIGAGRPATDAVQIANEGTGVGLNVSDNGPDGAKGTGSAINAHIDNAANTTAAVVVTHAGNGPGLIVNTSNTANPTNAATVTQHGTGNGVNVSSVSGAALAATAGTGIGLLATANTATSTNPAVKAQSNGKGAALVAATTANATSAAVQSISGSAQPAVRAIGSGFGSGAALDVKGTATFTRSNVLTIPAGANNALTAIVPGGLTAASHVLATIQLNSGTLAVRAAVPILSGGNINKIQIFLTGNAPAGGAPVGWFVFG